MGLASGRGNGLGNGRRKWGAGALGVAGTEDATVDRDRMRRRLTTHLDRRSQSAEAEHKRDQGCGKELHDDRARRWRERRLTKERTKRERKTKGENRLGGQLGKELGTHAGASLYTLCRYETHGL